jgi:serine/threonine protein kinase
MLHVCPTCQRSFDEPGFCPFDRAELVVSRAINRDSRAGSNSETVVSKAMDAARPHSTDPQAGKKTDVEPRRETLPLTPTPSASPSQPAPPDARTKLAPFEPAEPPKVRAVSAADSPQQALDAYKHPRTSEYDKLVGETLDGRYYIEKKIGEGGMGVVFSARHAVIERPLAIKVLKREVMRDTATIRRFVQEAKAASRIGHPNIVDVTDFGTTPDGMTYSVMEYVTGQTLGRALRAAAPFHWQRAIRIAAQIARALGAAHDKGIVHRDLKPENVFLVDRDGRPDFVKIVDFGIAKVAPLPGAANEPRLTRAGSVFGTPEYMAPEQAAGRGDTDGRVDVYALGVILYEMLVGKVPHRGDSMVRTLAMQMLDPAVPPRQVRPDLEISPELEAVVMRALAKRREQRYQTMGEILGALDALQTPVGVSVTGSPVYALSPVPPGADPGATPLEHSAPLVIPQPITERASRAKSDSIGQTRRLKDEPEFVTRDKPVTFDHVFTDEMMRPHRRRWPILVLFALIFGAAAGAIALVVKSRQRVVAVEQHDSGVIAVVPDAIAVAEVHDAAEPPADAAEIVLLEPDAGRRVVVRPPARDAAVAAVITDPSRRVQIQVLTKPEGARLYVGTTYRGPGGTNLEEPFGTRLEVICKQTGYKPGRVELVFDGSSEAELCVLQRIKICIDNIKNPFDDCEIDPTKPIPGP